MTGTIGEDGGNGVCVGTDGYIYLKGYAVGRGNVVFSSDDGYLYVTGHTAGILNG